MPQARTTIARGVERILGRRRVVRASRFLLNHARRDGPNEIAQNGELLVQRTVLQAAGSCAVVFDVGANLGQWSSQLISQSSAALDLHVFEPSAGCMERLRGTLRSTDRVAITLNQEAASSVDSEATLFKPHELAGSSSLHPTPETGDHHEAVRTRTLTGYCHEHGIEHIDLLKIDAEGHDHHVLLGSAGLLQERAIEVVQFEYNHRWIGARHYLKDVFELVNPWGYRVGKVTPEGIEWYPRWVPQLETLIEANYVAALPRVGDRLPAVAWWAAAM